MFSIQIVLFPSTVDSVKMVTGFDNQVNLQNGENDPSIYIIMTVYTHTSYLRYAA